MIVFDLDGVLVDSRVAIGRSINHALGEHGFPEQSLASLERFVGPPLGIAFAELTGQSPDSSVVVACVESYRDRYRESSLRETAVFPGVPAALGVLGEQHRLAVATSKSLAFAEPLLAALGLRDHFEHVAGPGLHAHSEDKAATIRGALSALGGSRAAMVGDRCYDILGAHACGIPAVGVSWGIGSADELTTAGATAIVDDPAELPRALTAVLSVQGAS